MDVREKQSNEKRLIDANALISYIDECSQESRFRVYYGYAKSFIDDAPTVDAVEVTRCRDCKYRGTDYCIFHIKGEPADEELLRKLNNDFCSYGKREGGAD